MLPSGDGAGAPGPGVRTSPGPRSTWEVKETWTEPSLKPLKWPVQCSGAGGGGKRFMGAGGGGLRLPLAYPLPTLEPCRGTGTEGEGLPPVVLSTPPNGPGCAVLESGVGGRGCCETSEGSVIPAPGWDPGALAPPCPELGCGPRGPGRPPRAGMGPRSPAVLRDAPASSGPLRGAHPALGCCCGESRAWGGPGPVCPAPAHRCLGPAAAQLSWGASPPPMGQARTCCYALAGQQQCRCLGLPRPWGVTPPGEPVLA